MKNSKYVVLLIGALLLVGCQMPFPDTGEVTDETVGQPTAVSDPNATSLPDGSGSIDPNVGGGAPNMMPATNEPTAEPVEVTETAVSPTSTSAPPTETAVPPTIAPTATSEPTATTEPTATAIPPTAVSQLTHTVAPGENLYRISLQYGLSWPEVAEANGITNPDGIVVGQVLIIPTQ